MVHICSTFKLTLQVYFLQNARNEEGVCSVEGKWEFSLVLLAPCDQAGFQKLVYRLIVLFLPTEIFSKRRKIYAWNEEKPELPYSQHPRALHYFHVHRKGVQETGLCIRYQITSKHILIFNQFRWKCFRLYFLELYSLEPACFFIIVDSMTRKWWFDRLSWCLVHSATTWRERQAP